MRMDTARPFLATGRRTKMLRKTLSAGRYALVAGAIGGSLLTIAWSWIGFSAWYVVAGALFAGVIGFATWSGWVRICVALGCLGCVFQPSLFPATMCDGQALLWPVVGTIVGVTIGLPISRWSRNPPIRLPLT
jgi:hypothetical protein